MGLPNSGKTSLLNALLSPTTPRFAVASAGAANAAKHPEPTTKAPVEVRLDLGGGRAVRVIDTPGWELVEDDDDDDDDEDEDDEEAREGSSEKWDQLEERVAGDMLRRNLGRVDRVKDILPLASYIVSRSNAQDLMLAYNVPYFKEGDVEAFLTALARVNGRVKKHGDLDLDSAARILVRDWAVGSFPYYSTPPKTAPASTPEAAANGNARGTVDMSAVLGACKTRKELRASGGKGVIRFRGGEVDQRQIVLDDDYTAMAGAISDDEEDDDEDAEEEEEEEEEELEEDADGDDDEEEPFALAEGDGEELELEDGPEPSSGSDIPDNEQESDDDDDDDEEEEPVPPPKSSLSKGNSNGSGKNKRKLQSSPGGPTDKRKKAKRVSFGREVKGGQGGMAGGGKKGSGAEREFKGLGKRRR